MSLDSLRLFAKKVWWCISRKNNWRVTTSVIFKEAELQALFYREVGMVHLPDECLRNTGSEEWVYLGYNLTGDNPRNTTVDINYTRILIKGFYDSVDVTLQLRYDSKIDETHRSVAVHLNYELGRINRSSWFTRYRELTLAVDKTHDILVELVGNGDATVFKLGDLLDSQYKICQTKLQLATGLQLVKHPKEDFTVSEEMNFDNALDAFCARYSFIQEIRGKDASKSYPTRFTFPNKTTLAVTVDTREGSLYYVIVAKVIDPEDNTVFLHPYLNSAMKDTVTEAFKSLGANPVRS